MGGAQIYLKREDLNHTGAHKINNVIGQAMLAKRMGKPRIIAETGVSQHGVPRPPSVRAMDWNAWCTWAPRDVKRQSPNVYRMKLLGATVVPVESGSKTLKDALNEAMRDWVANVDNTFYIIGTVAGPHPYPMMVRDFQSVIGKECIEQMPEMLAAQKAATEQPDVVVACVDGGSNAMGIFHPYIPFEKTRLIGVEAARRRDWNRASTRHRCKRAARACCMATAPSSCRTPMARSLKPTASARASITPAWAPEHAWLQEIGRAEYVGITDKEALDAFHYLCRTEGHHPGARIEPRRGLRHEAGQNHARRPVHPGQPLGPWRQGTLAPWPTSVAPIFIAAPAARGQSVKGGEQPVKVVKMSRIESTFSALKAQGRTALIPYVTAGFPFADITPALMHGMVDAGADVIELGVPFSDPMADGPCHPESG